MEFQVEHVIHASPAEVAGLMFNPNRELEWITNATKVEVLTAGPIAVGARVRREGGFLGRTYSWVSEVTEFDPERIMEMNFVEGPTHGTVTFEVSPTAGGSIAMIHTKNKPNLPIPGVGWIAKHDVNVDLGRLAKLVAAQQAAA